MDVPKLLKQLSLSLKNKSLSPDNLIICLKIITSSMSSCNQTVDQCVEQIKKKLDKTNPNNINQILAIIAKLKEQTDSQTLSRLLYFLHLLSENKGSSIQIDFSKYLNDIFEKDKAYCMFKTIAQRPLQTQPICDPSYWQNDQNFNVNNFEMSQKGSYKLYLLECHLLKDLTHVMVDIDGNNIKIIRPDWKVQLHGLPTEKTLLEPATYEQISKIAECGWLFSQVYTFTKENSESGKGKISQALSAILQQELIHYYRFVAIISSLIDEDLRTFESTTQMSPQNYILNPNVTVLRLLALSQDILHRFKILTMIILDTQGLKGCEILSVLYNLSFNGDPIATQLIRQILVASSKPLSDFIFKWIMEGVLSDHCREFIIEDMMELTQRDPWTERYGINQKMIPPFVSPDLLFKIFATGKSVYFLKEVCHVLDFRMDNVINRDSSDAVSTSFANPSSSIQLLDPATGEITKEFAGSVGACYGHAGKRLVNHILQDLHLVANLGALRDYVLLARGDFSYHLIYLLERANSTTLSKSSKAQGKKQDGGVKQSGTFFVHQMVEVLDEAIRSSNALHERPDILNRLTVLLSEPKTQKTNVPIWETFGLKYMVDGPLKVVLTNKNLHKYQALFLVVWRTKWLGYMLNKCWRRQKNYTSALQSLQANPNVDPDDLRCFKALDSLVHSCHIGGTTMTHFIQQIQYYFNFEVMTCAWEGFTERLKTSGHDLDHIINAHEIYINHLMTGFLLGPGCKVIYTHLLSLYDLILQFLNLHSAVHKKIKQIVTFINSNPEQPIQHSRQSAGISTTKSDSTFYCFNEEERQSSPTPKSTNTKVTFKDHEPKENGQFTFPTKLKKDAKNLDGTFDQVDRMVEPVAFQIPNISQKFKDLKIKAESDKSNHPINIEDIKSLIDKIHILRVSFQDLVKDFLFMLVDKSEHNDKNLHLFYLSFRLDFNDYYKSRDLRLRSSLTFESRYSKSQNLGAADPINSKKTNAMSQSSDSVFSD